MLQRLYHEKIKDNPLAILGSDYPNNRNKRLQEKPGQIVEFGTHSGVLNNEKLTALDLEDQITIPYALAFQKDSEFLKIFNFITFEVNEYGFFDSEFKKWIGHSHPPKTGVTEAKVLDYNDVVLTFIVLAWGIGSGISILFLEALINFVNKKICEDQEQ